MVLLKNKNDYQCQASSNKLSLGAAHDTRLHVVSKEVESTIEYVCKVGACMETHDHIGVRKQVKRQRFN